MDEFPANAFEVLGDTDDLTDDFFEALAGLLLELAPRSQPEQERKAEAE
jgi:hypothetical protein